MAYRNRVTEVNVPPPDEMPSWFPECVADADQVLFLVLDGLGWSAVQDHAAVIPRIAQMEGGAITTVATPSK